MKNKFLRTVLCALVLSAPAGALDFDTGLYTLSAGSWVAFPAEGSPLYFSKLSMTAYMTVQGFKVVPGIPLAWTYESGSAMQRIFPGDGTLYIGRRFGNFEPRLGVIIPLGYGISTNWKKEAWIGTNNEKAQIGLAYGRADDALEGMPLTIEAMISTPITVKNTYLHRGSVSVSAFAKTFWRLNDLTRWGAELMVLASRSIWDWTYEARPGEWENVVETSTGVVPNIWIEYRLVDAWYCSVKAGFGPGLKASNQHPGIECSGNSLNVSLGVQWYP